MAENNDKQTNKSLFLYTALIFLVALVMIIISFFGQTHLESTEETKQKAQSITERASVLSEENLHLTEQVSNMQETIEQAEIDIKLKDEQIQTLTSQSYSYKKLLSAYVLYQQEKYDEAKIMVSDIDPSVLEEDGTNIYQAIISANN